VSPPLRGLLDEEKVILIVGSVVNIEKGSTKKAIEILKNYNEIEVYSTSEDGLRVIIVFEVDSEETLDRICNELKQHDEIIDIGHHYCNFEDAIEKIEKGEITPEMLSFKKKIKII
jgi:nitrate reductase NapAB chaperone NapD